jgi:hypothetical protein
MSTEKGDKWETAVKAILGELGGFLGLTELEGDPQTKIRLAGDATKWQCDLIALRALKDAPDSKRVRIECKCWSDGVEQNDVAALAWSLQDTGADGLIVVNREMQDGAQKVAKKAQIGVLEFTPGDTAGNYRVKLENWFKNTVFALGLSATANSNASLQMIVKRADGTEETVQ